MLQAVWPHSFVEEGNLSQNIFLLRKALTTPTNDFRYIITIPGRGYQFASAVELVSQTPQNEARFDDEGDTVLSAVRSTMHIVVHEEIDDTNANSSAEAKNVQAAFTTLPKHRGLRNAAAALVILGIATGSFFWIKNRRPRPSSQTIVLADFENRTGEPDFDVVLKKALEIDLDQSPYLNVMSEQQTIGMLPLMGLKPDAALTWRVAKEICQRSNRQVLLQGSIANLGHDYLLMLQAADCTSGKKLAEAKAEATDKEKALDALDHAAAKLRHDLGESGQSVEQFQVPIVQATTSSLEALKAYSIGGYMALRAGKEEPETLPLFQRAVELDPQFAMAYAAIAADYYNLSEYNLAKPYYQKAFELSGQVSEREKLEIRADYYAYSRKDLQQGIREYQLWAETYPQDWVPWSNIANDYTQLGQFAPAIVAAEQALKLDISLGINYSVLARAYVRANRFADAKATAVRAMAVKKDSYALHATLFQIAFAENDQARMSREVKWSQGRSSEWFSLDTQALAAATAGKYKQAENFFQAAYNVAIRESLTETADDILIDQATVEFEVGLPDVARDTLKRVTKQGADNPDLIFLDAQLGDLVPAQRFLAAQSGQRNPDTLMNYVYVPRLRAEFELQHDKPLDALATLEPTVPYEFAGGFTLIRQRSQAYLRSGQAEKATLEYQKILAHRGVDPISPLFPLAHLWLARIDTKAGRTSESRMEYETFFADWKDADSDLPILSAARREYAALTLSRHL